MKNIVLAVFASGASIMVLFNGAAGAAGNQTFTALITGGPILALLLFSDWRGFKLNAVDVLFAAFFLTAAVSLLRNGLPATKDTVLFAMSLAAYPAIRLVPIGQWSSAFALVTALIVAVGATSTAFALYSQWDEFVGHPVVLGFGHAATVFLTSLSFLILALASSGALNRKRTALICAAIALPLAIFAASQVRFTFLALAIALACTFLFSSRVQRLHVIAIMLVAAVSIAAGLTSRHKVSLAYLDHLLWVVSVVQAAETSTLPPEECLDGGSPNNSIAIRRALLRDGIKAVPSSGWFGTGLSSFIEKTCAKMDAHNSILQASVEFGWLGGLLMSLMIAATLWQLWPFAGASCETRFVMASFIFVVVIDLAHGHLTGDGMLFLFTGYAARLADVFGRRTANEAAHRGSPSDAGRFLENTSA